MLYAHRTILIIAILSPCAVAQTRPSAAQTYPDTNAGFRLQFDDLISARKSGDEDAYRERLDAFLIPDVNTWIADHFSPSDATELPGGYANLWTEFRKELSALTEKTIAAPEPSVIVWSADPPIPQDSFLAQHHVPYPMRQIVFVSFRFGILQPDEKTPMILLDDFVYENGAFRYAGGNFPFWLDGFNRGEVSAARLINRVPPMYPKEARRDHIEGVVRIFGIIGKDGVPRNLTPIAGDAVLRKAALDAVQQWRYAPTSLSGVPVEVQTTIDVRFQLTPK